MSVPTPLTNPASPLMNGERLYGFSALALKVPGYRANSHVNSSTLFRWATRGVRTRYGRTIRMEALRLGTAWKSSSEAVARFAHALTEASLPTSDDTTATPTPRQRTRAASAASAELDTILG